MAICCKHHIKQTICIPGGAAAVSASGQNCDEGVLTTLLVKSNLLSTKWDNIQSSSEGRRKQPKHSYVAFDV